MTHEPLPPLTPEEGGLHGEIIDTPEARAWFKQLSEQATGTTHDPLCPAKDCCDDVTCDYCGGCRCALITLVKQTLLDKVTDTICDTQKRLWDTDGLSERERELFDILVREIGELRAQG